MQTNIPVVDLHCDLLYYLAADKNRTAHDRQARASIPQLIEGGVVTQILAIYTPTKKGSADLAQKQVEIFENLPLQYAQEVREYRELTIPNENKLHFLASIENASGLCEEDEPLQKAFERLERYQETIGPILYLSLTWNDENRFGGGNCTSKGLKKDGEALLHLLVEKGIAIDLSHTSDHLAHDILNYIDKKNLSLIPIASHSNFRAVVKEKRNLPEEFAKEISKRGGVIGLNFVKRFIGSTVPQAFVKQIEYADQIGVLDCLCLGADFFSEKDRYLLNILNHLLPLFHENYSNSACYPTFFDELFSYFDKETLEKIAYKNCKMFFERLCAKNLKQEKVL